MRAPKLGRFRSDEGRVRFIAAYDAALARWPASRWAVDIPTRYGTTHVNACGSESGMPIVLLHAFGVSSASWVPNVAALADTHPVFAPDAIGNAGLSHQQAALSRWAADKTNARILQFVEEIDDRAERRHGP